MSNLKGDCSVLFCSVQDVVTYLLSPVYVYSEIRIRITAVCLHVYVAVGWLAAVIRFGFGFAFALGGWVGGTGAVHTHTLRVSFDIL